MTKRDEARKLIAKARSFRGVAHSQHLDSRLADALESFLDETEPTPDEREALATIASGAWAYYQEIQDNPEFGGDFEDILAHRLEQAGFHRQAPITDAQVDAAIRSYNRTLGNADIRWRVALEAAREVE